MNNPAPGSVPTLLLADAVRTHLRHAHGAPQIISAVVLGVVVMAVVILLVGRSS